jgi:hypothetical protein
MGSGVIFFIFLIVIAAFCICGFIYVFTGLLYNHIEEKTFEPKLFWLSIGFLILTVWSIFSIVDCVKYDNSHKKIEQIVSAPYKEIKTFDIYVKDGETYLNAKNAKILDEGYISFDTEDGRHLETNAETLVEVHTEIIKE